MDAQTHSRSQILVNIDRIRGRTVDVPCQGGDVEVEFRQVFDVR